MKVLTEVFPDVPDSFEELRKQRAEFDAFYISAMVSNSVVSGNQDFVEVEAEPKISLQYLVA